MLQTVGATLFCSYFLPCPKDPAVLQILRRSELAVRSKFAITQRFVMATPLALTQFSWVLQEFSPQRRVHSIVQSTQNHVIQSKIVLELLSNNMSSKFQLKKFPELFFISTQRCQLGTGAPSGWVCLSQCAALSKFLEIVACLVALSTKTLENIACLVALRTKTLENLALLVALSTKTLENEAF